MADSLRVSDGDYCHCCLSKNDGKPLQFYNIRNQLLKIILQMENLLLCYVCKSLAEKTELFVRNIEMCQTIFDEMKHSGGGIENALERITPIYDLNIKMLPEIIEFTHKYDTEEFISNTAVKIEDSTSDLTIDQLPDELATGEEYKSEDSPLIKQDLNTELNEELECVIKDELPDYEDELPDYENEENKIFLVDESENTINESGCKQSKRKTCEGKKLIIRGKKWTLGGKKWTMRGKKWTTYELINIKLRYVHPLKEMYI